jgi:hypothetical protein
MHLKKQLISNISRNKYLYWEKEIINKAKGKKENTCKESKIAKNYF